MIGAGQAGLSVACEVQKHGIRPFGAGKELDWLRLGETALGPFLSGDPQIGNAICLISLTMDLSRKAL